jgi:hypothetical protein
MVSHSAEAAFKVIGTNNGEPDDTLTLRKLLINRFRQLEQSNEDITIDDLLITHNIFLASSFKPFISTSSIYLKEALPKTNLGSFITIDLDNVSMGDFIHDMYLDVIFDPIGDKNNKDSLYKFRYTDYPGIRLIDKIELWLNGKKVDSYNQVDMLFYMQNELNEEKRNAFKRCVGQSVGAHSHTYNNDMELTESTLIYNGYQTFKTYHEQLHMTIPLLFWFNKYMSKSYPILKQESIIINHSKNYLKIWFMPLNSIIQAAKYNLDSQIVDDTTDYTPHFKEVYDINTAVNMPEFKTPKPTYEMSIHVNNIFTNEEVRNFYMKYIDMYMIITHQSFDMNIHRLNEVKIKDLSDMSPYLYFAFRTEDNEKSFMNWHKFTIGKRNWYAVPSYEWNTVEKDDGLTNVFVLGLKRGYYDIEQPIINDFTLYFDTLPYIINKYPSDYLNYKSQQKDDNYNYNNDNKGIYILPFCRKFTDIEPTGHINFNRIQEIILRYTLNSYAVDKKMKLYISSKRINILSISDDNVDLKWASHLI